MRFRGPAAGAWLSRRHKVSLAAFVVLLMATLGLVLQTYANLDRADEIHQRSTFVMTNMTNVQREAGLLGRALLDAESGAEQLELRHDLLHNQVRLLTGRVRSLEPALVASLDEFLSRLDAVEEALHHPPPGTVGRADLEERIGAMELSAKRLHDRTEQAFFAAFEDANRSRARARLALVGLALATFVVGCGTALSLRQRVGAAFARAYGELEKEIEQRRASETAVAAQAGQLTRYAQQLEAINSELVEADEAKNRFLSVVSHELRTPLTAILGLGATMVRAGDALTGEQRRDFSNRIVVQAQRQMRLIEDLLDVSQILNHHIHPRPVHLNAGDALAAIIDDVHHPDTGNRADVQLGGDLQAPVYVDPDHLAQIVSNLVTNAYKYGAPPVVITVIRDGRATCIEVTDHGDGVPAEFIPHMFEAFSQSSTGDRRTATGLGLGLAIVQELTSANGGAIDYTADDDSSTFAVRLPIDEASSSANSTAKEPIDTSAC